MFADSVLAVAIDCEIKWLYNASHRLGRPILRTIDDTRWWRMLHHLAGGLGVPLADAARAADLLLAKDPDSGRVRLTATRDDAVSISVDVARFFDGAAIAMAGALQSVAPRSRGRPRTRQVHPLAAFPATATLAEIRRRRAEPADQRLVLALSLAGPDGTRAATSEAGSTDALTCTLHLADTGVESVVIGSAAAAFHGMEVVATSLDVCAGFSARNRTTLASVLNGWGARPRGVPAREAFRFEASTLKAADVVAVRVGTLALNIVGAVPGLGEYEQLAESSESVAIEGRAVRVLGSTALLRTEAMSRPADLAAAAALSAVLAAEGTR